MRTLNKVVIVGSHDLDMSTELTSQIGSIFALLGDTHFSIRANTKGRFTSPVETFVWELAHVMFRMDRTFPLPSSFVPGGPEREEVYNRDYELVEDAVRVIAFFHPSRIMEGGTGHVVHAALQKNIPVEAWSLDEDGALYNVGSDEGFEVDEENSEWMQSQYQNWRTREDLGGWSTLPSGTLSFPSVWTTGTPSAISIGGLSWTTTGPVTISGGTVSSTGGLVTIKDVTLSSNTTNLVISGTYEET